jgi:enoyl-CoA hydratase
MSILHEMISDGIMVVTLNRPEKLNALDVPSKERLVSVWNQAATDPQIRVIVLRGAGEKAFCSGSDVKEIQRTGAMVTTDTLMRAIPGVGIELNKPVIAALHGFRIAAVGSRLGFPEVQHGMISGISAITLPRIVGESVALDLMLTGRLIDASEALACGLVHGVVPDSYEAALSFAQILSRNSPKAVALTKQLVLADRRKRILEFAAQVDRARSQVTGSPEYRDLIEKIPKTVRGRME